MAKHFYVYILASGKNGTLYTGMTSNIYQRMIQHKNHQTKGFTDKYNVTKLVYAEYHDNFLSAVTREKRIKTWQRAWKIRLIEELNPNWEDLLENGKFVFD